MLRIKRGLGGHQHGVMVGSVVNDSDDHFPTGTATRTSIFIASRGDDTSNVIVAHDKILILYSVETRYDYFISILANLLFRVLFSSYTLYINWGLRVEETLLLSYQTAYLVYGHAKPDVTYAPKTRNM